MTDSSEYKSWAYLKLTSTQPLATICEHLGSSGDGRPWDVGYPIRNGRKSNHSSWELHSGLGKGEPLDAHLRALWKRMEKIRPAICNLPKDVTRLLQCVGYVKGHSDVCALSTGHFATAAYYQLDFDFDFYFDDDFGDEDMGKPYWKW
ncbi:MAG: DUF4279 domain-containing protein [Lentilitoribacter sp.]